MMIRELLDDECTVEDFLGLELDTIENNEALMVSQVTLDFSLSERSIGFSSADHVLEDLPASCTERWAASHGDDHIMDESPRIPLKQEDHLNHLQSSFPSEIEKVFKTPSYQSSPGMSLFQVLNYAQSTAKKQEQDPVVTPVDQPPRRVFRSCSIPQMSEILASALVLEGADFKVDKTMSKPNVTRMADGNDDCAP